MLQVILTVIFYVWLFLILALLWLQAINFHRRMQDLQQALINVSKQNADAATKSAEATLLLAKKQEE